ncbi:CAP domain-containing protein [Streptomyces sp. NPDC052701]|uniref:CAP domain-containing protein n=1 Tax=Streptomyces sp. NPDC052701 TaxID=3155533 RepID=UPI00341C771F
MGRHRRSDAGRAATGRATGVTQADSSSPGSHDLLGSYAGDRPTMGIAPYLNPEAYAETYAKSEAYLFAPEDGTGGHLAGGGRSPAADTAVLPGDSFRTEGFTTDDFVVEGFTSTDFTATDFTSTDFTADGFAPDGGARRAGAHRRRKKKAATPVRTGLLGVSAAVALGTVAVATGAVPGLDNYKLGGSSGSDNVQAGTLPTNAPAELGGTSGSAEDQYGSAPAGPGTERSTSPAPSSPSSPSSSSSPAAPTATPEKEKERKKPAATASRKPKATPEQPRTSSPTREASKKPRTPGSPELTSAEAVAGAEVLRLVNEERAKVGCSPVAASSALTGLAQDFSEDMAARGFFDHTDPDGATPWDRAEKAGITGLGGENIARGQADAQAVMDAWMNSPGHRANILNCDFKTLGVGVHFGSGGPWWTQNFGY